MCTCTYSIILIVSLLKNDTYVAAILIIIKERVIDSDSQLRALKSILPALFHFQYGLLLLYIESLGLLWINKNCIA